jgi:hypothetical protein
VKGGQLLGEVSGPGTVVVVGASVVGGTGTVVLVVVVDVVVGGGAGTVVDVVRSIGAVVGAGRVG